MFSLRLRWVVLLCALAVGAAFGFLALPLFQPPRVLFMEPADGASDIAPTSPITITFSMPMARAATEAAFRVSPRVNGAFTWQDNQTLVWTPRRALPISQTLTVQISQAARSWLGRAPQALAQARFTTLTYPHVVASTPALDAQFIYIPNRVTLTFDRALNAESVRANLTITPTLANETLRIDANTVTLDGFFQPRTRYQIEIAAGATDDAYHIPLERAWLWAFTVSEQYPNFSILNRGRVLRVAAQDKIRIPTQFTNVSRLDVAVYPITPTEFDANANAPFETWYAFQPTAAPIQQQRVLTHAPLDQYAQQTIALEPLPQGTYYLRIATPEGPDDAQLLQVSSNGAERRSAFDGTTTRSQKHNHRMVRNAVPPSTTQQRVQKANAEPRSSRFVFAQPLFCRRIGFDGLALHHGGSFFKTFAETQYV